MALKTNLVSHWELEETGTTADRVDSHGTNDCVVTNGTIGNGTGKINTASSFLGSTANRLRIDLLPANLSGGTNVKLAMSCWVKLTDLAAVVTIASAWVSVASKRAWRVDVLTDGTVRVWARNIGDTASTPHDSTVKLTAGTWYFVAWWYDGANVGIRIDATEKTIAYTGDIAGVGTLGDFAIGSYSTSGLQPVNGLVDELSIWQKTIAGTDRFVTTAQLDEIYNSGSGLAFSSWDVSGSPSGLLLPQKGARGEMRGAYRGAA